MEVWLVKRGYTFTFPASTVCVCATEKLALHAIGVLDWDEEDPDVVYYPQRYKVVEQEIDVDNLLAYHS